MSEEMPHGTHSQISGSYQLQIYLFPSTFCCIVWLKTAKRKRLGSTWASKSFYYKQYKILFIINIYKPIFASLSLLKKCAMWNGPNHPNQSVVQVGEILELYVLLSYKHIYKYKYIYILRKSLSINYKNLLCCYRKCSRLLTACVTQML